MRRPVSPQALADASPLQEGGDSVRCRWCNQLLDDPKPDKQFCDQRCRQAAWRIRQRRQLDRAAGRPRRMAYADPPYPGLAKSLYGKPEVDLGKLISFLGEYDGWALSTSARSLRDVLPLCPPGARVAAWVKPIGASPLTFGVHNCWEPLIVVPGRDRRPGKRDWLSAQPARRGGYLPGRKPIAFAAWLFSLLGLQPGDQFDDLFPGTGVVSRAWAELSRRGVGDAGVDDGRPSSAAAADASSAAVDDRPPRLASGPSGG